MFQTFHKNLLNLARDAAKALAEGDNASGFSLSEQLSEMLSNLHIINEHATFKETMKGYGGLYDILDEAMMKFDELLPLADRFSKVISEVDTSKDYAKLKSSLVEIIKNLQWFEDNESALNEACGVALEDISEELKEIEHVKKLLNFT